MSFLKSSQQLQLSKHSFKLVHNFVPPVFFKTNEIKNSNREFDINPYLADVSTKFHIFISSQSAQKLCLQTCFADHSFDAIYLCYTGRIINLNSKKGSKWVNQE